MNYINNSLTCVINGDWNKTYTQPHWIGENLFDSSEIEVLLNGIGFNSKLAYKFNNVIVETSQSQFQFKALNMTESSRQQLEETIIRFLDIAKTPELSSFGFNCSIVENNALPFVEMIDNIKEQQSLSNGGIDILDTTIKRKINCDNKTINMIEKVTDNKLIISFNEHHDIIKSPDDTITSGDINGFLQRCTKILELLDLSFDEE